MAKKKKEKRLPSPPRPPPSSSSVSSSSDEDGSPRPASSALKKLPDSSVTVPSNGTGRSSDSRKGKEGILHPDESNEPSHGGGSLDDSGAVAAKSKPLPPVQGSRQSIGAEVSNPAAASAPGSESGETDSEEEDSSYESDQPSRPPPQEATRTGPKRALPSVSEEDDDDSEYSSDSDRAVSIRSSSRNAANPLLKPLNSKPMDGHAQLVEKGSISTKGSGSSPSTAEKKKSAANGGANAVGDGENIKIHKTLLSRADEIALLQGVLEYKESHHVITTTTSQVGAFLHHFKTPLSVPIDATRIYRKLRTFKANYFKAAASLSGDKKPNFSYKHDYTVYELSKKIWGSHGEGEVVPENKIGRKKTEDSFKKVKEKGIDIEEPILFENTLKHEKVKETSREKAKQCHFHEEFPSLHRLLELEHAKNTSLLPVSHIPNADANNFETKCKKLDITEIQLQVKKQKLLGGALKLIQVRLN